MLEPNSVVIYIYSSPDPFSRRAENGTGLTIDSILHKPYIRWTPAWPKWSLSEFVLKLVRVAEDQSALLAGDTTGNITATDTSLAGVW